jgi:transcriptional regulator with XRE-family HTH domain
MSINEEIADRIGQFGRKRFKTQVEFAEALGILPQNLNEILKAKRPIGPKLKRKLEGLGCNMTWLLIGKYPTEFLAELKAREKEEEKILNNLRLLGLDTWEKVNDILAPTLKLADKLEEYKPTKKGKTK